MKPIHTQGQGRPVAIRMEFVGFDEPSARGSTGTARAAKSLLRRRLAGAKRLEVVLSPPAAKALADLRERTGFTYKGLIEEALLAASKR